MIPRLCKILVAFANYYTLTRAGRQQLDTELSQFQRVNQAIIRVIQTA